ncbi:hypothetical protein PR001_g1197 [Phytophthora rubi]|uniref:Uncharacterized protein n=1 Tax=Phytophthora rubi TaxID=129364 RepID=A0A6A3NR36_9STRA|nr:hypothetical protein PR002_g1287 [Phytophthora rubi]KAE9051696.1 hypothetical protein PR001_g1197 [Phytophthora rubi]
MAGKRLKVAAPSPPLSPTQREALSEIICDAVQSGSLIAWRKLIESPTFVGVTYETLRREGKAVKRQLSKRGLVSSGPTKRRISDLDEATAEPEPQNDRVAQLEALVARKDELISDGVRQIQTLKQQVTGLNAAVAEKDEQLAEQDKLQKQVEALQQCISELSAIIASKDVQLEEANTRYDALLQGVRQLASEG